MDLRTLAGMVAAATIAIVAALPSAASATSTEHTVHGPPESATEALEGPAAFAYQLTGFPALYLTIDSDLHVTRHSDAASAIADPTAATLRTPPKGAYGPLLVDGQCLTLGKLAIPYRQWEAVLEPCTGAESQLMKLENGTIQPLLSPTLRWAGDAFIVPDRVSSAWGLLLDGLAPVVVSPPVQMTSPDPSETLDTPTPMITGVGTPGSSVSVRERTDSPDSPRPDLCTTAVDDAGSWVCQSSPLADGYTEIFAIQIDTAGEPSADIRSVLIDAVNARVTITEPAEGQTVELSWNSYATFRGAGDFASSVLVRDDDGKTVCKTETNTSGTWWCSALMAAGPATVTAEQTTAHGDKSVATVSFAAVDYSEEAPLIDLPGIMNAFHDLLRNR